MSTENILTSLIFFLAIQTTSYNQVTENEYHQIRIDTNITVFNENELTLDTARNYIYAKHSLTVNYKKGTIHKVRKYHKSPGTNVHSSVKKMDIEEVRILNDGFVFMKTSQMNFLYNTDINVIFCDPGKIRKFYGEGVTIKVIGTPANFISQTE